MFYYNKYKEKYTKERIFIMNLIDENEEKEQAESKKKIL